MDDEASIHDSEDEEIIEIDDEEEDEIEIEDNIYKFSIIENESIIRKATNEVKIKRVADDDRMTSHYLTKLELSRIISVRVEQLGRDPTCFVDVTYITNPKDIAVKEIVEKKCPLTIRRRLPDDSIEYWMVNEMEYFKTLLN